MPPWITDAVLVAFITGMLGLVGGRVSARGQVQAASISAAVRERELMVAPYEALAQRVEQLETEASDQRVEADVLRGQVADLRVELASVREEYGRSRREWRDRDAAWQAGWDRLRDRWPECRLREDPPPYPTSRIVYDMGDD